MLTEENMSDILPWCNDVNTGVKYYLSLYKNYDESQYNMRDILLNINNFCEEKEIFFDDILFAIISTVILSPQVVFFKDILCEYLFFKPTLLVLEANFKTFSLIIFLGCKK